MDVKYKPHLAVNLTTNYSELLRNFVADSHNHDVCVCIHLLHTCIIRTHVAHIELQCPNREHVVMSTAIMYTKN